MNKSNSRLMPRENRRKIRLSTTYANSNNATVITGDCRRVLPQLPARSAHLILTSPPYNLGKEYETITSLGAYTSFLRDVLIECVRVLARGGSLCVQVGSTFDAAGHLILLDRVVDNLIEELSDLHNLRLQNRIIWHFDHGLHAARRFSGRYETILWYTDGETYTFDLDAVRVPQKYPGKRAYKGPRVGQLSGHPLGKNPSDFWMLPHDVWDIPNVKAKHVEKANHPCQFPIDLASRLIKALTRPGQLVLDPFGGSGTTAAAAVHLGRRAVSIDKTASYSAITRTRVKAGWRGTLRYRASAPPMEVPNTQSVAKLPAEFEALRASTSETAFEDA